jgi:hypothetical protein
MQESNVNNCEQGHEQITSLFVNNCEHANNHLEQVCCGSIATSSGCSSLGSSNIIHYDVHICGFDL